MKPLASGKWCVLGGDDGWVIAVRWCYTWLVIQRNEYVEHTSGLTLDWNVT